MTRGSLTVAILLAALAQGAPLLAEGAPAGSGSGKPSAPAKKSQFSAEILVLHATNSDKGIDPRIGKMPELEKPPFSAYKSYVLIDKATQPLAEGKPKTLVLPNKRVLQTELLKKLSKDRVKIAASINKPGGKTFLPLLEVKAKVGQAFIVAGQSYKGGILVLVIRVVK